VRWHSLSHRDCPNSPNYLVPCLSELVPLHRERAGNTSRENPVIYVPATHPLYPCAYEAPSTLVENPLQIRLFMQNKPNPGAPGNNPTSFITKAYERNRPRPTQKNKPNQTQCSSAYEAVAAKPHGRDTTSETCPDALYRDTKEIRAIREICDYNNEKSVKSVKSVFVCGICGYGTAKIRKTG